MAKQLITIEVEYDVFASDDEDNHELGSAPEHWDFEAALDHYADCTEAWGAYYNNRVRVIQASPVTYSPGDEVAAEAKDTTLDKVLLENGIVR